MFRLLSIYAAAHFIIYPIIAPKVFFFLFFYFKDEKEAKFGEEFLKCGANRNSSKIQRRIVKFAKLVVDLKRLHFY